MSTVDIKIELSDESYAEYDECEEEDEGVYEIGNAQCNNCEGCFDCEQCDDCTMCETCEGCTRCDCCDRCTDCVRCGGCNKCTRCVGCTECEKCYMCIECTDISNRKFMYRNKQLTEQ